MRATEMNKGVALFNSTQEESRSTPRRNAIHRRSRIGCFKGSSAKGALGFEPPSASPERIETHARTSLGRRCVLPTDLVFR